MLLACLLVRAVDLSLRGVVQRIVQPADNLTRRAVWAIERHEATVNAAFQCLTHFTGGRATVDPGHVDRNGRMRSLLMNVNQLAGRPLSRAEFHAKPTIPDSRGFH